MIIEDIINQNMFDMKLLLIKLYLRSGSEELLKAIGLQDVLEFLTSILKTIPEYHYHRDDN